MLDFTLAPPRFFLINEKVSHAEAAHTARSLVDRRAVGAGESAPPVPLKRRRDDGLNRPKRGPLEW
jgi:hypothetical protein